MFWIKGVKRHVRVVFKCISPTLAIRLRGSLQEGGSEGISCARLGASCCRYSSNMDASCKRPCFFCSDMELRSAENKLMSKKLCLERDSLTGTNRLYLLLWHWHRNIRAKIWRQEQTVFFFNPLALHSGKINTNTILKKRLTWFMLLQSVELLTAALRWT